MKNNKQDEAQKMAGPKKMNAERPPPDSFRQPASRREKNDDKNKRRSHKLSWLLRHGALESGLAMDEAGWASVDEVCRMARCSKGQLDEVVAHNNKSRFVVEGTRIRAVQGHSTEGTPVTANALEASWEKVNGIDWVVHGTRLDLLTAIAQEGLLPIARTHVHLAASADSKVGKRAQVEVLLHIAVADLVKAGISLYRSPNGVLLARQVPASCIHNAEPISKRAKKRFDDENMTALFLQRKNGA